MKEIQAWNEYCKSLAPAVIEACAKVAVNDGAATLTKAVGQALPDWKFRHALARGGWYRLGGVVSSLGERVADNLENWAEARIEACQGDFGQLLDEFADQQLFATRLVGQTHYLVASAGPETDNFLQLEIECLQETRTHQLFANEPASLDEIVDPPADAAPMPLGFPFFAFRRVLHIGAFLKRMRAQNAEPAPIHRMLDDWGKTSAGATSAYANHWVIATREHLDRYQQPVFRAQPIATLNGPPPAFEAAAGLRGLPLHDALSGFDREAGYPMAWYFHLLSTRAVPHWVAQSVVEDALEGFAYLPQRDIDVVRGWLHRPYSL